MTEDELFAEAFEKNAQDREAFLASACGPDTALRDRVLNLLSAYEAAGDFMDRPAFVALHPTALSQTTDAGPPSSAVSILKFLEPSETPGSLGRLGPYDIREHIAQGGMGIVLKAFDENLRRTVALKVLSPAYMGSGSARQRFVREARAAAAVVHDNVVAVHAVDDSGPLPFLVMQCVTGPTLQAKLDKAGRLPVADVARIGKQIAEGLSAAHALGLVHRDIKPANILLEENSERVKITDFGLARAVDDANLTQPNVIKGTPNFMSPEQANGEPVDHRSDLFSLGSLLYALCAGQPPFRAPTSLAVMKRVVEETPTPVRQLNPDVPAWLANAIAKLLAKDPGSRYASAAEVAAEFGQRLATLEGPARPDRSPILRLRQRVPAIAAVLLFGVSVVGARFALVHVHRSDDPPKSPIAASATANEIDTQKPDPSITAKPDPTTRAKPDAARDAKGESPFDRMTLLANDRLPGAPKELVGFLGGPPRFFLPGAGELHYPAVSPDRSILAVPFGRGVVLFDVATGFRLRTLAGHGSQAFRPAFSSDGNKVASGSEKGVIRIWDVATGNEDAAFSGHASPVECVAFDVKGSRLASADHVGAVSIWKLDGTPLKKFQAHEKGIRRLAFNPVGALLATASADGSCKVWNAETWAEVASFRGKQATFDNLAWSPDGNRLAIGDDNRVTIWHVKTQELLHDFEAPSGDVIAFSPSTNSLLTAPHARPGFRAEIRFSDLLTGKKITVWDHFSGSTQRWLCVDSAVKTIFSAQRFRYDGSVRKFDAETGAEHRLAPGHYDEVRFADLIANGRAMASASYDLSLRLWDLEKWKAGESQPHSRLVLPAREGAIANAVSPCGRWVFTNSSREGEVHLRSMETGKPVRVMTGSSEGMWLGTFSKDGSMLAAFGNIPAVDIWDTQTGKALGTPLRLDPRPLQALAFSPDGKLLAVAAETTLYIVDIASRSVVHILPSQRTFKALAFSPTGDRLAASTTDTARLYDVATGRELRTFRGHNHIIIHLAFHPTLPRLASTSVDGTVRIWNVDADGPPERTFDFGSMGFGMHLTFTPEGRHLLVGTTSGAIAILRLF